MKDQQANIPTERRPSLRLAFAAAVLMVLAATPDKSWTFYNTPVGSKVANAELTTLSGAKAKLLGKAEANAFVFFRPDQEYSELILKQLAQLERKLQGKSVRWVAIVSDAYPLEDTKKLVMKHGLKMPVLVDKGDVLYGRIGVVLHPVIGIADKKHTLTAYQPFRKINYVPVVEARIRRLLGEIDDEQVELVLNPPPSTTKSSDENRAKRNLKLSVMLFRMKKYDNALKSAQKSAKMAPQLAAAQGLVAAIFAAKGDCKSAAPYAARALALDPKEPYALDAHKACSKKS